MLSSENRLETISLLVYAVDDPFSAVDMNVGNQMFHECVLNTIRDKTRVIVSNFNSPIPIS